MEITLDDVSGLPETLKPLAVAADGKFKLNLAQLAPASELEAFKGKSVAAQNEAIDRRKALKAWEALGATPEEVQAKLAKGADPAIIDQMRAQMAEKETTYSAKLSKIMGERAMSDLKAELARNNVVPEGLDLLANFGASRIKFDEDGNVRIMAADGATPMVGAGANGGATLSDLAKQLAASIPHLVKDGGAGGSGKQPGNGGTPAKTMKRDAFLALPPIQQAALIKDGITPID
jgi:hypothetical protein